MNAERFNAMVLELARLRVAVHELDQELAQVKDERDAFMLEVRQQWESIHAALNNAD